MKKKILFVASEFASGMIPFAASVINTLSENAYFDVYCVCVNSGKKTYMPYINADAKPVFVEYPSQKWKKIIYKFWPFSIINSIKKVRKEHEIDTIHFLTGDFTLANFIRFLNPPEVCYTVHDMFPHEVQNFSIISPLKKWMINHGYKICRDHSQNLTTSSRMQYNVLKNLYPRKNISFTNFPTLVTKFIADGTSCPPEIEHEQSYILFFGNVVDYKGVDVLISAFKIIQKECNTKLVIAGTGAFDAIDCPDVIRINRFINDVEVRCLFEKARLVVYPYKSATMSGVLSLAFFFRKRILLSDVPFFRENASDSTIFFKNGDVLDLMEKLKMALNLPAVDNDDSYEKKYSKETMLKSYVSFYEAVNE